MANKPVSGSIDVQERDKALLLDLFESRIMTLDHIAALHFEGRKEAAKKRVQKLKAAGLMAERPRRPYEPAIHHLTRKAFKLLLADGLLDRYPRLGGTEFDKRARVSETTVHHELEVMSVKAAMVAAIQREKHLEVAEFSTWPRLFQFSAYAPSINGRYGRQVLLKPDGFIRIHEHEPDGGLSEHTFFLEVDRSTETQDRLAAKAVCYVNYYKSGGLAMKHGRLREDYQEFPFRVLMVFKSEERRDNTARRLLEIQPPVLTQVWLATMEQVLMAPLESVWTRPADYRDSEIGNNQVLQYRLVRDEAVG